MRIKKFNEADLQDISADRVDEVKESMTEMSSDVAQKSETIDSLINELNNFLKNRLPFYMLPKTFIYMERFQLNSNGKIDKTVLPS